MPLITINIDNANETSKLSFVQFDVLLWQSSILHIVTYVEIKLDGVKPQVFHNEEVFLTTGSSESAASASGV